MANIVIMCVSNLSEGGLWDVSIVIVEAMRYLDDEFLETIMSFIKNTFKSSYYPQQKGFTK
jgi:hypothetical protein